MTMDKKMLQVITDYKEKIDRLEAEIATKDKSLRDIQSALDAFGKMDIDSGMLFDIIQVAFESAEKEKR